MLVFRRFAFRNVVLEQGVKIRWKFYWRTIDGKNLVTVGTPRDSRPTFVIHGKMRRLLKKELSKLKLAEKMEMVFDDLVEVLGGEGLYKREFDYVTEIESLEKKLRNKYIYL